MKYAFIYDQREGKPVKREYHIHKCGDCPERVMGDYCIRKNTFVDIRELYDGCPLDGDDIK